MPLPHIMPASSEMGQAETTRSHEVQSSIIIISSTQDSLWLKYKMFCPVFTIYIVVSKNTLLLLDNSIIQFYVMLKFCSNADGI